MEEKRERWNSRTAFVMAAVGSAVGLGNVWRFPVTCYKYGGGAFFIPYFVALLTAGVPLMILEYGLGQMFQGSAPRTLKAVNRHTEWVGWLALLTGLVISIYYAVIMAYSVEYLVYAFKGFFRGGVMPWSSPPRGSPEPSRPVSLPTSSAATAPGPGRCGSRWGPSSPAWSLPGPWST